MQTPLLTSESEDKLGSYSLALGPNFLHSFCLSQTLLSEFVLFSCEVFNWCFNGAISFPFLLFLGVHSICLRVITCLTKKPREKIKQWLNVQPNVFSTSCCSRCLENEANYFVSVAVEQGWWKKNVTSSITKTNFTYNYLWFGRQQCCWIGGYILLGA